MYVMPVPLRPAMSFVNTSKRDRFLVAAFQQNALQRVIAGDEAEVSFDAVPGRVFKGKVRIVLDAIAAGQILPSGSLVDIAGHAPAGRALAVIDLNEDLAAYQVPLGAFGETAIYTHHFHHIALLRKILLRMRSWQNYVFIEH